MRDSEVKVSMKKKLTEESFQRISVIVPKNPFVRPELQQKHHCLCALDVAKLMEWWPGKPHSPHRDATKIKAIQRSLDWRRVGQIAAYLLQQEITNVPDRIDEYFREIYEPTQNEPGREWPPKVSKVMTPMKSAFPTFSNILLHVNGAQITQTVDGENQPAHLVFDANNAALRFSVIDGQHRINGAYFAVRLLQDRGTPDAQWDIPAEVFLDLDGPNEAPQRQAQIFIDVNFNQKKVDRSLVVDLFPTARGKRDSLDDKERAQDIARKLMLEIGPLVGMIQIPGIKFGVKDVITLATLSSAIEGVLRDLRRCQIDGLEMQTEFLAQCLAAWLEASGRFESPDQRNTLNPDNVAYQGRVLVSILDLIPAILWKIKRHRSLVSESAQQRTLELLQETAERAGLLDHDGVFIDKKQFKERQYLGSGGIGRFRNTLWAAFGATESTRKWTDEKLARCANEVRAKAQKALGTEDEE
jgi:DGQHR domain-containing protein